MAWNHKNEIKKNIKYISCTCLQIMNWVWKMFCMLSTAWLIEAFKRKDEIGLRNLLWVSLSIFPLLDSKGLNAYSEFCQLFWLQTWWFFSVVVTGILLTHILYCCQNVLFSKWTYSNCVPVAEIGASCYEKGPVYVVAVLMLQYISLWWTNAKTKTTPCQRK